MEVARVVLGDVNLECLTSSQVRIMYVVPLPFRLRLPQRYQFRPRGNGSFQLWVRNQVLVEGGVDILEALRRVQPPDGWEKLFSEVILIQNDLHIDPEGLSGLKEGKAWASVLYGRNTLEAVRHLNEFLVAYGTGAKLIVGGAPLRLLSQYEFLERINRVFLLLCPETFEIHDQELEATLKVPYQWKSLGPGGALYGDLDDLAPDMQAEIEAAFSRQRLHAFYEFAFQAKSRMLSDDHVGALILACVALEGAHAAFLREVLRPAMEDYERSEEIVNNLLREQGIHTTLQLSWRLFLRAEQRPPEEVLDKCRKAIEIRNDILHARMKRGHYKLRGHSNAEIGEAYGSVLEVYGCFLSALEEKLQRQEDSDLRR
jgi:hypothetical protein